MNVRAVAWVGCVVMASAGEVRADEPLVLRESWAGNVDFLSTGAPLAKDSNNDGKVDVAAQPAMVTIAGGDVPNGAFLLDAFLYWGATRTTDNCQGDAHLDKQVTFTPPGGAPAPVAADVCYCSASPSYDMQLCRAEVTELVTQISGQYAVEDLEALLGNTDTANASFAVVLVYRAPALPQRRIGLYDGLLGLVMGGTQTAKLVFDDLNITTPPQGDLTWYALEGDVAPNQNEFVEVKALPGGGLAKLSDPVNPAGNPFNRTINTTNPAQSGVTGVDIDRFSLAGIVEDGDSTLEITYSAGIDKYWIAFNIVGVDVFEPVFSAASDKTWALTADADGNGEPSPGDTVTYTVHLENSGTAPGTVTLTDEIAAEAASFVLVDDGGGVDMSVGDTVTITDLTLAPMTDTSVVIEIVLADVPDMTPVNNTAVLTGDGGEVALQAPVLVVRRDGDGDGSFDSEDNCPELANPGQEDGDMNGVGDACEAGGSTGGETDEGTTSAGTGDGTAADGPGDASAGETAGDSSGSGADEAGASTITATGTGGGSAEGGSDTGAGPTGGEAPTSGGDAGGTTQASGGSSSGGETAGADDGGCGCRGGGGGGAAMLVPLLALARRRRRG